MTEKINSQNLELRDNIGLNIIPITSAVNPLGTIIYGPNPDQENYDKDFILGNNAVEQRGVKSNYFGADLELLK